MSIYFDNSATTLTRSEALDKYIEVSRECFGNPSSLHAMGVNAEKELDAARREVLTSLAEKNSSVVFSASGSEANNLAIFGRAFAKERYKRGSRIITTDSEHASVSEPLSKLCAMGFDVVKIPTRGGELDFEALASALTENVILVTMMMVNNETGAIYDIASVSKLMKERSPEAVLHIDATQSYLKIPFTKKSIGADMITLSSHKIEGPKGVGALVIDNAIIKNRGIAPLILGGGQELGLRSGTENVPGIASFGCAVRLGFAELGSHFEKLNTLRSYFLEKLSTVPELSSLIPTVTKSPAPHIVSVTVPGIKSETLLHFLSSKGIYVSSGSACSSNSHHLSSALIAYGKTNDEADSTVRISFSYRNEISEIDALCKGLAEAVLRLARKGKR